MTDRTFLEENQPVPPGRWPSVMLRNKLDRIQELVEAAHRENDPLIHAIYDILKEER